MIARYREFVPRQAEMYKAAGKKFTCEDLVLQVLIDFASQNELPLSITNGSGTYRPQDYNSIEDFTNDVLTTSGANDLQEYNNTVKINIDEAASGDIILERKDGIYGNHAMMIEYTTNISIYTIQGNSNYLNGIYGSSKILGAGNPSSLFYCGKLIEIGRINISSGDYYNYSTNIYRKDYVTNKNVEVLRWNFINW